LQNGGLAQSAAGSAEFGFFELCGSFDQESRRVSETRNSAQPAVLTNREMERLLPSGSVKTFLTRSGRREILAVK
jgi:hypothetical protein